ncbi:putative Tubulin binding cofactor A [Trypanosoma vivax]|uniref:Tubulin-specific chaperone A n=1 Tax=Trypanosoma vivax (strain Y486) TaxID=1055687 RepID=G0U9D0_TRYVY|nr:putative tubulin binding cofactor A [Trypanosoma vivax]KAH8605018.1 putative Tubulin binding cofactor A [Trypanosoma vivax]CCC54215.1 putative tubulin binding cofactor A [Trypanosoma vivax Y486]
MSSKGDVSTNRLSSRVKQNEDPTTKALKIKINSLKRNLKDLEFSKKEVVQETNRLEKFRLSDSDKVKQQENVVAEAQMMISHSENRVRAAAKELRDFLSGVDCESLDAELVQDSGKTLEAADSALQ